MKNKKKNPQLLKQEQAHQKNLYLSRIRSMMGIFGSESAFDLLDQRETDILYMCRLRPAKIIYKDKAINGALNKALKILNDTLTDLLKTTYIPEIEGKKPINLYDFLIYTETLYLHWRNAEQFNQVTKYKESFPFFEHDYTNIREGAYKILRDLIENFCWIYTSAIHEFFILESEILMSDTKENDTAAFYNNYVLRFQKPETEILDIDGKKRTVFRIGFIKTPDITWLSITPEELGKQGLLQQFPLKIYIQTHVIKRIGERLGTYFASQHYIAILNAILHKDVCMADDGNFLIAYCYNSVKLGYLKADIIGDKLLLRTFLFLTNNGTPEGKKLAHLIGVQKEDKKYLGIDKLDTFVDSDIEQNERLKTIFYQAGCGSLFEMKKNKARQTDPTIHCANYLTNYLGLEEEKQSEIVNPWIT